MAKSGRLEQGYNIYGHYRSISNLCDVFGQQSNQIRWKTQNKGYTPFKVIKVGTNRKAVCDFLLVINSNWRPIVPLRSYRSLLFKFWTLCVFEPPFWGLRDNVRRSSWAHWKAGSGLPISDNWTFFARCYGWGAAGENTLWGIKTHQNVFRHSFRKTRRILNKFVRLLLK